MENLEGYIGKVIKDFTFTSELLTFNFDTGEKLELYARGDCCSNSWFEQLSGEEALVAGSILHKLELIDNNELPELLAVDSDDRDDHIKYYGLKILSSNGYADIDMRNSSNGYYGGYVSINNKDGYGDSLHPDWD